GGVPVERAEHHRPVEFALRRVLREGRPRCRKGGKGEGVSDHGSPPVIRIGSRHRTRAPALQRAEYGARRFIAEGGRQRRWRFLGCTRAEMTSTPDRVLAPGVTTW